MSFAPVAIGKPSEPPPPPPTLTSLSHQDDANSSAETITLPSTIQAGDLLVMYDRARWSIALYDSGSDVIPTGWTGVNSTNNGTTVRMRTSMKIAVASDASKTITGMDGSASNRKIVFVFRGNVAVSTILAAGKNAEVTSGDPAAQVINSGSSPFTPLVSCGGLTATNLTGWSFSPAAGGSVDIGTDTRFAYKIYNSSPADVTVDTSDVGANNSLISFYIRCT